MGKRCTRGWIASRENADQVALEVLMLINYVRSDEEHQDRLTRYRNDACHLSKELLHKYKKYL